MLLLLGILGGLLLVPSVIIFLLSARVFEEKKREEMQKLVDAYLE